MKPILFFLGFVLATVPGTGFPAGNNDLDVYVYRSIICHANTGRCPLYTGPDALVRHEGLPRTPGFLSDICNYRDSVRATRWHISGICKPDHTCVDHTRSSWNYTPDFWLWHGCCILCYRFIDLISPGSPNRCSHRLVTCGTGSVITSRPGDFV